MNMISNEILKTRLLFKTRAFWLGHPKFSTTSVQLTDNNSQGDPQLKVFKENATKWWSGEEFRLLREMNHIRVPFIRDGLDRPISEAKILDVGCGGGILSEPLARLGANVVGIDPVFESINQAQIHSQVDSELKGRVHYRNCNIEDFSPQPENIESFDAVVASEVLEHIEDVEGFLKHCTKVLKPNGSLFITTINQTPLSWLGVIFMGEYVLQQLPKGTHTYNMFVNVKGLRIMLERLGYHIRLVNGFMYEPIGGKFHWTPTTLTHYALQAVKLTPRAPYLNLEQKRYLSKQDLKKLKKPKIILDETEMTRIVPYDLYKSKADSVIETFVDHIQNKLTTRANAASLERLKIEVDGFSQPLELRDVAQISMKGTNLIVINLATMPEAIKPTMAALEKIENISPQVEVNTIFVPVPRITRETREALVSSVKKEANETKSKLKSLYSEFSSLAKKKTPTKGNQTGVSEDLVRQTIDNLHYDVQKRTLEIDSHVSKRESELLNR